MGNDSTELAYAKLVEDLAAGAEVPAHIVLTVCAAAGRSVADLERDTDARADAPALTGRD